MKKGILILLWTLCACVLLCACDGAQEKVEVDYGESAVYTEAEMDAAIQVILDTFADFEGCTLHALTYAGDIVSENNLGYCRTLSTEEEIEACMVFDSSFHSPKNGGGAWEADTEYTWSWYLGRTTSGEWVLLTYGYA